MHAFFTRFYRTFLLGTYCNHSAIFFNVMVHFFLIEKSVRKMLKTFFWQKHFTHFFKKKRFLGTDTTFRSFQYKLE